MLRHAAWLAAVVGVVSLLPRTVSPPAPQAPATSSLRDVDIRAMTIYGVGLNSTWGYAVARWGEPDDTWQALQRKLALQRLPEIVAVANWTDGGRSLLRHADGRIEILGDALRTPGASIQDGTRWSELPLVFEPWRHIPDVDRATVQAIDGPTTLTAYPQTVRSYGGPFRVVRRFALAPGQPTMGPLNTPCQPGMLETYSGTSIQAAHCRR